ncbi:hypothetical protein R6Q59_021885 [Mikania micrantha]
MEKVSNRALVYVANLAVPTSQVIVISANLGCASCRERFYKIMIRINGLKEYTVDVRNNKVIMRGKMKIHESLEIKTPSKIRSKFEKNVNAVRVYLTAVRPGKICRKFGPLSKIFVVGTGSG